MSLVVSVGIIMAWALGEQKASVAAVMRVQVIVFIVFMICPWVKRRGNSSRPLRN
jgi:hypothetical protein